MRSNVVRVRAVLEEPEGLQDISRFRRCLEGLGRYRTVRRLGGLGLGQRAFASGLGAHVVHLSNISGETIDAP